MGLARSTYHDAPTVPAPDDAVLSRIRAIGKEFEAYGHRRICAELHHQGLVVNSKKVRRLKGGEAAVEGMAFELRTDPNRLIPRTPTGG